MNESRILIVEDEPGLIMTLEDNLTVRGYRVEFRTEGIGGESAAVSEEWDLIILDIMLPGKDGFEICRAVRKAGVTTPVLMLTARSLVMDRVMGLNLGADDFLAKPFDMGELLARIQALLRRRDLSYREEQEDTVYSFGEFTLNRGTNELFRGDRRIELNTQEYQLLLYFLRNPERVIHRNELLDRVWGYDSVATTRTIDVHVAWLRKKLGEQEAPRHLLTLRGRGYRFTGPVRTG